MGEERITAANIRKINQNRVYQAIYHMRSTSKLQLVQSLEMGLSTVSHNLNQLYEAGLIKYDGFFASTGGRKAYVIRIVPDKHVSIGIELLKDRIYYVAVDLYGHIIHKYTVTIDYVSESDYYRYIGIQLNAFITQYGIAPSSILGVSIATQGIVSRDGFSIVYGAIMGNSQMRLENFQAHIPYRLHLEHDSKASAFLEHWNHPDIKNAAVLLLNYNLGGALIIDGNVQSGDHMRGGLIEHMCVQPDGPVCYCGKRGCLETFCSVESLENEAEMKAADFFSALRSTRPPRLQRIWRQYLQRLAFAIRNLSIVLDTTFILSGYLAPYLIPEDISTLLEMANDMTPFPLTADQLILGECGEYTPAVGGALYYIQEFLESV